MADDTEEVSNSQESISPIFDDVMNKHEANGGQVRIASIDTLKKTLLESHSSGSSDEECAVSSISKTEVIGENSASNLCERSPADSGYQPLSNDTVSNGEDTAMTTGMTSVPAVMPRHKIRGDYNFSVSIPERHEPTKNMPYTFSHVLGKLYVKMDINCPVMFPCEPPPMDAVIRAMILYSAVDHAPEPVTRCLVHHKKEESELAWHVLRVADHFVGGYGQLGNHLCVVTPYKVPDVDESPFVINYKFRCLSSCAGGMNRRSTCLVFTLEGPNGEVLGRDYIDLKVCSSPGRDKPQEEGKKRRLNSNASSEQPARKQRGLLPESSRYRCVFVREEHYECLLEIVNAFNLSSAISPEQRAKLLEEELQRTVEFQRHQI